MPAARRPNDTLSSHPVYHVNYYVSGGLIITGFVTNYFSIDRFKNKPLITDEELAGLNEEVIPGFDSWALDQSTENVASFEKASDVLLTATSFLPLVMGFNQSIRKDWVNLLVLYTEAHAVTVTVYNYSFLGPTFQNKFRPIVYYNEIPNDERKDGFNRNSFYSGHVASCAISTFFMAKVYNDYFPSRGIKNITCMPAPPCRRW